VRPISSCKSSQNFKLTIAYDGTNYAGWQRQKNAPTIQETIEKVLYRILQQEIRLTGASRTDAGAHAIGQVSNFKVKTKLSPEVMLKGLNGLLPRDIRVLEIENVPTHFHSQYGAKKKLYRYTIIRSPQVLPQERFFVHHYPYPLNVKAMRQAAKYLIGTHDFASFQGSKGAGAGLKPTPATRKIYRLQIIRKKDRLLFEIEADGFLYTMVRTIAGTLLEVGSSKRSAESVKELLRQKDRTKAGVTLPAKGLYLVVVKYGH
jgi:tRNA pseudouridine38-40 synthase